jgi:hypothetical protein
MGCKKYQILANNTKGLAFSFIGKPLFHPCKAHIISRLDVVHKFLEVLKNIEFNLKNKVISLWL